VPNSSVSIKKTLEKQNFKLRSLTKLYLPILMLDWRFTPSLITDSGTCRLIERFLEGTSEN